MTINMIPIGLRDQLISNARLNFFYDRDESTDAIRKYDRIFHRGFSTGFSDACRFFLSSAAMGGLWLDRDLTLEDFWIRREYEEYYFMWT